MFSQIRWPEAESVVMLGCNDDPFHSGITGNLCPLVAIKPGGIEDGLFFITITPFLVCESINSKMDKHVVFHFMQASCCSAGTGPYGSGGSTLVQDDTMIATMS